MVIQYGAALAYMRLNWASLLRGFGLLISIVTAFSFDIWPLEWLFIFWLGFIFCAGVYFAWPRLRLELKIVLSIPAAAWGIFDVFSNYTVAVLFFFDLPPDGCYTFTKRISWYKNGYPNSLRGKISFVICIYVLNPFQAGGHCK